jgi:hypothetical protein
VTRCLLLSLLFVIASAGVADARTWQWNYSNRGVGGGGTSTASVTLSSTSIATSNRVAFAGHPDVVYSCSAKLADVARAIAVSTGNPSLLIQLRAGHAANCQLLGSSQGIVLPADDGATIASVAQAINDECCGAALRTPPQVAAAQKSLVPAPATPHAAVKAHPLVPGGPVMSVEDWVEHDGLFSFVRVRNNGTHPIEVTREEVADCSGIEFGCAVQDRRFVIDRKAVATIATVAASNTSYSAFTYHYTAVMAPYSYSGSGAWAKRAPAGAPRISAAQVRTAEASLLNTLPAAQAAGPPRPQQPQPLAQTGSTAHLLHIGAPEAPVSASGTIQLRVLVDPNGSPVDASIVSISNDALADAAMEAAVTSTYAPAIRNGKRVRSQFILTLVFDEGRLSAP